MKKFLLWAFPVLCMGVLVTQSYASVVSAETSAVDELLDLILNDTSPSSSRTGEQVTGTQTPDVQTTQQDTTQVVSQQETSSRETLVPAQDIEFVAALARMSTNGLTKYAQSDAYMPDLLLTRQQAAKFFVVLQETYVGVPVTDSASCGFTDSGFDATLYTYVQKACAYRIMMGSKGIFRPNDPISKPEFTAAIVRIVEGAMRDESGEPRWLAYFQQARDRGLTKEQNAKAFDVRISRYEAALLLYRASTLIKADGTSSSSVSLSGGQTTGTQTQTALQNSATGNTTGTVQSTTMLVSDPALQEAVFWMYDHAITKYNTIEDYRAFDGITRQEAAKIFTLFRGTLMDGTPDTSNTQCVFTDLDTADQTLIPYITQACQLGILKGANGLFNPQGLLTKPQAVAILVRMLEGVKDETMDPRRYQYYERAVAMGMIQPASVSAFDKNISRYEIAMLLYNSKVKYELIKNLNNNFETNKLIYTVADSVTTGAVTGEKQGLISINTQILGNADTNGYVIDLFGDQYRLEKQATQKYLQYDYVWYGKILSLDKTTTLGTAALTISNGVVISGVLRPYGAISATYLISPSQKQPYYDMIMQPKK